MLLFRQNPKARASKVDNCTPQGIQKIAGAFTSTIAAFELVQHFFSQLFHRYRHS